MLADGPFFVGGGVGILLAALIGAREAFASSCQPAAAATAEGQPAPAAAPKAPSALAVEATSRPGFGLAAALGGAGAGLAVVGLQLRAAAHQERAELAVRPGWAIELEQVRAHSARLASIGRGLEVLGVLSFAAGLAWLWWLANGRPWRRSARNAVRVRCPSCKGRKQCACWDRPTSAGCGLCRGSGRCPVCEGAGNVAQTMVRRSEDDIPF